jgi:alpha-D-ribose 1-methylphosphonate 5-triphosphate synthase subunit PhnG
LQPAGNEDRSAGSGEASKPQTERQRWMAVLARASGAELDAILERLGGLPAHDVLKPAEAGTVMVEARAGGTGRRFNLGEATLTRCVVRLADGGRTLGFAYALGTDRRKALLAALLDALLQDPVRGQRIHASEILPLARRQQAARALALRKAAATKVNFFTLVRGHD